MLAIVLGTALELRGQVERLIAGAAAALALGLPSLLNPRGMGMGDAKLIGVLGLYLGAAVAPAFFVAFLAGTAVGSAIVDRKGMSQGRKTAVPFGPFLALGDLSASSPATNSSSRVAARFAASLPRRSASRR